MGLAFKAVFGLDDALAGEDFHGRTDRLIIKDALQRHGLLTARYEELLPRLKVAYLLLLQQALREDGQARVLPGAAALLAALSAAPDTHLGLATGNFRDAAFMKLQHLGLADYFAEGGFGDDAEGRPGIVRAAIARLEERLGASLPREGIYMVGDTLADVEAARACGVVAVAVASGPHSPEALRAAGAAHVFASLSDAFHLV